MKRFLYLVVLSIFSVNIILAQTEDKINSQIERDRQQLIRLENETITATEQRNLVLLNRLIADDFVNTTSKGVLRNKAETIASWTNNAPKNSAGEQTTNSVVTTLNEVQVRVNGKVAVVTGLDRAIFKNKDGGETISEARFTDVWEKRKIGWQMIANHVSRVPPLDNSPAPEAAQTNLEPEFTKIIQDEVAASRRQDKSFYENFLGDTRLLTDEKGDVRILAKADALKQNNPAFAAMFDEIKLAETVEDVRVLPYGDTAIVSYRRVSRLFFTPDEPVNKQFRVTEVFIKRDGRWQAISSQTTIIPLEPIAAKINPKIYDDYVGQYKLFSKVIYTISKDGDKLYFGTSNRRELVPENDNTFVIKGDLYRVIFIRGDKGEVTRLRLREFPGVEYSALKIK